MELYKYFPKPSDRMGTIWTLSPIKDAYIVEFGPAGTTHFAVEGMMQLNAESKADVFTTDMDDSDVAFGKTERLENTILEVDETYSPKVIFVMASSISAIIGTDVESVCYELEDKVSAKLIPITTGGYTGDYAVGIERTMEMLAKEVVRLCEIKKKNTYNIIGNNIDRYNFLSDVEEIKNLMKNVFDMDINATFTAYTTIEEIENAGQAEHNIVLRGEGIKAAKVFEKTNEIDYYYGRPYGLNGTMNWIKDIAEQFNLRPDENYIKEKMPTLRRSLMNYKMMTRELENKKVVLVGELDIVLGLADFVEELGLVVDKIIVKHSVSSALKKTVAEKYEDLIEYDLNEMQIEAILSSTETYLTLGDGATLKLNNKTKLKLQIANPNFTKYNVYPYTPFMGLNGALYFTQCLYELEKTNIAV